MEQKINNLIKNKEEIEQKYNELIKNKEEMEKKYNELKNFNDDLIKNKEEIENKYNNFMNIQRKMDSMIIKDENIVKMLKNWINPNDSINFELLYRGTKDGDSLNNFYLKCENKSPTISIIKTEKGKIIGGYTTIPWIKENVSYITDENAFIFSVDSKEKYNVKKNLNGKDAVYHNRSWCCCFGYCGDDLAVGDKFLQGNNSYCCGNGDYYSFETTNDKMLGTSDKGIIKFKITELEIYHINFIN